MKVICEGFKRCNAIDCMHKVQHSRQDDLGCSGVCERDDGVENVLCSNVPIIIELRIKKLEKLENYKL